MDDQQSYLLSGLLTRQFALGRIVRFRKLARGRQATTYEILTAQQREYLVWLLGAAVAAEHLDFVAAGVNALDAQRFTVVPFIKNSLGAFVAEGPQGSHMLVSLAPVGSAPAAAQYSEHAISQVGLRLAWMHRLLAEQLAAKSAVPPLAQRLGELSARRALPTALSPETLLSILKMPAAQGWVHGDLQLTALLHDDDFQLRTIVDWSLLHYGCPLEDLVDAFLSLCVDGKGNLLQERGAALLESYDSLARIRRVPWTPVVASWIAQRLLDAAAGRRPLPDGFDALMQAPERLTTALASCL